MSASEGRPQGFGPTVLANGLTCFRFWAPAARRVDLEIEHMEPVPMISKEGGWFETDAPCGAGARYRFRIDGGLLVPDPASRFQPDDVHGPSLVVDPSTYAWLHGAWQGRPWNEVVLYELHAGAFGGFAGVEAALPKLAALGVTAVELMPVNDFPGMRNWGYDGVLPYAPDHSYGTPDDLRRLVDSAHGLGLMMFLDVVYNHFGPDGNYLGAYAPQFFREDIHTPWGAAIDFRRPEVRRFFTDNALSWIHDYRFDGLRFDAVHAISEADWLDEMAAAVRSSLPAGRNVHLVLEHDGNVASHLRKDFDAQWNDDLHHVLHVLLSGEKDGYYADYADGAASRLARALAEGFVYQGDPSSYRKGERRGTPSSDLAPTAFVSFLQNHDQIGNRPFGDRLTSQVSAEKLEAAIALQLLSPQIPMLFMGEEDASESPFLYFTDHHGELAKAVREGRRREFAGFKGFGEGQDASLIPDPNAPSTFDQSRPKAHARRADERHALYRALLALRARAIVPHLSGSRSTGAKAIGPAAVRASWMLGDRSILTLASNLGDQPCAVDRPTGHVLYEGRAGAAEGVERGTLAPDCTLAYIAPPGRRS